MSTQNRVSKILCAAYLLSLTAGLWAQGSSEQKPYIGVIVQPEPLSLLLRKHLQLQPDEGLLLINVQQDSPADRVGLEKDDIVVRIEDQPVTDYAQFVAAIRRHAVGDTITLGVIHRGERKDVLLELAPRGDGNWKYEMPPQRQYRPHRAFEWEPGNEQWHQIPFEDFQPRGRLRQHGSRYNEHYYYNDGTHEVTIDGAPDDPDTRIVIESDGHRIETTIADVDQLDEPYRDMVKDMLERAKEESALSLESEPWSLDEFFRAQPPSFGLPHGWHRPGPSRRDPLLAPDEPASEWETRMRDMERQFEQQMKEMRELMEKMQPQQPVPKKNEKVKI